MGEEHKNALKRIKNDVDLEMEEQAKRIQGNEEKVKLAKEI